MSHVEHDDSRAFLATLSSAKRAAIRELHRVSPWHGLVALPFLAIWWVAGAAALRSDAWTVRLLCYALVGAALHALGVLMHECVHGNFFRRRSLDRWAAFLLGAPTLVSGAAYRVTHRLHHRYNRSERDPDEFINYVRSPRLLSIAFYAWSVIGMLVFLIHVPVQALRGGNPRERAAVLVEYALLAALLTGIAAWAARAHVLDALLHVWVYPMIIVLIIVNVRGWSEHMLTEPGHPLRQTRTVTSNPLVRFFLCNLNYHLEHHLFPSVPWYHLPRLHALLEDEIREAGAPIYRSYLRFLWDAVRIGVHGLAPRRAAPAATVAVDPGWSDPR